MSDLRNIIREYNDLKSSGTGRLALVTVLEVYGSSFRRPGAMMLVTENSRWFGAISGGCLEGDALRRARHSLLMGQSSVVMYDTVNDDASALGPRIGCNGIVKVLIEPIESQWIDGMSALDLDKGGYLITKISSNGKMVNRAFIDRSGEKTYNEIADWPEISDLNTMVNVSIHKNDEEWVVQELPVLKSLVICGGGNHILPMISLAKTLGWRVIVTDPCVAHSAPAIFPEADLVRQADGSGVAEVVSNMELSAFVITSHSHEYVQDALTTLLDRNARYIGLIGNRIRLQQLLQPRFGNTLPANIHAPVGLDLGGNTPEELALSVIAQVQAFFNDKSGLALDHLTGYIHDRRPQEQKRDQEMNIQ